MLGQTYDGQNCSAARALEVIGERWSLLIMRDVLFKGITRFADLQRSQGIARSVLTARLDRFVAEGLLERRPAGDSKYQEYVPTAKGLALRPVIIALMQWGDHWVAPAGPPILFRHAGCGGDLEQRLACERCGEHVPLDGVSPEAGPGATAAARPRP